MAMLWANMTGLLWHPTTSSTSCSTTLTSTLTSPTSSAPFHSWIPTTTSCTTSSLVALGTASSIRISLTSSASWTTSTSTTPSAPSIISPQSSFLRTSSSVASYSPGSTGKTATYSASSTTSLHSTASLHSTVDGTPLTSSSIAPSSISNTAISSTSAATPLPGSNTIIASSATSGRDTVIPSQSPSTQPSSSTPALTPSKGSSRSSSTSELPASDSTSQLPSASGGVTASSSPGSVATAPSTGGTAGGTGSFTSSGSALSTGLSGTSGGPTFTSRGSLTDSSRVPSATNSQSGPPSIAPPIGSSATLSRDTVTSSQSSFTGLPSASSAAGASVSSRGSLTSVPSRPTRSESSSSASTVIPSQSTAGGTSASTFSSSAVAPSAETSSGIPNFTLSRTTTSSGISLLPPFSLPSPGSSAPPPGLSLSLPGSSAPPPGFSLSPPGLSLPSSGLTLPSPVPASTTALTIRPPGITLPPTGPSPITLPPGLSTSTTSSTSDDRFFWWNGTMFTYTGTTTFPPVASATGTITEPPASVTTEIVPSLSSNQWYTTIKGGKHTVVPVIWCKKCGGGVIIWNLWPIPRNINIDFHIQFPKLPVFRVDCFRIFGIRIWGDCGSPKTVKEDPDDPDDGKNPPPNPKPTNDPNSTAKPTSEAQSSSESRSESSCTASMVTNTAVTCVPTTSGTRTSFSCSTSMSAFSGCTVTGTATTTTKSATPTPSWESSFCDADGACSGECPASEAPKSKKRQLSEAPKNQKRAWGEFADFDKAMGNSWNRAAVRVRHRVSNGMTLNGIDGKPMPARSVHKRWKWPPLDPSKPTREDVRFWLRARHAAAENGERVAPYGVSSADWVPFNDEYVDIAVQGLYGCTSIIIVSKRGAWMSHIFELPTMTLEDFWTDLDPAIFYGDGRYLQGLNDLSKPGSIFDPATRADDDFKIFIFTPDDSPRRRGAPQEWWGDGVYQYPERVEELKSLMNRRFGVEPDVHAYYRLRPAMSDEQTNWAIGIASKDDLKNLWETTSSGHYYLEYNPIAEEDNSDQDEDTPMTDEDGNECKKYKVGYRLWVDSYKNPTYHGKPYAEKVWTPLDFQVYESDSDMGSDSDNSDTMALYSNKPGNKTSRYFSKAGNKTSACTKKPELDLCRWESCAKSCVLITGPSRSAIIARAFSSVVSWLSNQLHSLHLRQLWISRAKTPQDYLSYANFMTAECRLATMSLQLDGGDLGDGHGMRGLSSSRVVSFEDKPAFNFVLENMFGCTSLIVISRKGFWISHFWEDKNFENEELFQKEILEQMWTGRDATYVGLNDYKNPGGILDPDNGVQILILGPRDFPSTLEQLQSGVWPAELDHRHTSKWQRMISSLRATWPNANILLEGYVALRASKLWSTVQQARVVSPMTKERRWALFATREYGKILIQWDPKMIEANEQCDRDFAGYKVWADVPYPHLIESWDKDGLSPGDTKSRRDGACSVPPVSTWNTAATAAAPPLSPFTTVPYDSAATAWTYTNEPTSSNETSTRSTRSTSSSSGNSTSSTFSSTITSSRTVSTSSKFSFAPSTTSKRPSSTAAPKTTAPPKPVSCEVLGLGSSSTYCQCDGSLLVPATTRTAKNGDTSFDCPLQSTVVSGAAVSHPTWGFGQEGLSTGAWGISVPYRRYCRRGTMGGTLVTKKVGEMRRTYDCIVSGATMTAIGSSPGKPKLIEGV
ncbi:hypothetical protein CB0940_12115 [Cercospora beticola]|uniref:Uncharacterized protein n=1 Tax=Cercospora beticola TaxID=122368 RepID=A0A2G5GIZ2_CERBT|nr:hypothetical protein CB0940_12115 [Cercospora beticola]PIA80032.1 hypothetical protein CB0940_12115 [Cercospora beticola]WPB07683.1 hypothetical protein RHO25_012344 [Cercospora beticola]